jgi:hypothetical protein
VNFWHKFLENASNEALAQVFFHSKQTKQTETNDIIFLQFDTGVIIYNAVGPNWHRFGKPRTKRPLKSIVLDEGVGEMLVHDLAQFCQSKKWLLLFC